MSQNELDNLFGEEGEPETIKSFTGDDGGDSDDEEINPEDIPEPESIPESLSAAEDPDDYDDDENISDGRGKRILIGMAAVIVLIAVVGGGLFFARGFIVSIFPSTATLFELAGVESEVLGAGLEFRNVRPDREVENNTDTILVRGTIANITDLPRPVPTIRAALFDTNGEEIEAMSIAPEKSLLNPGEKIEFEARFKDAPATARQVGTTFTLDPVIN